MAERIAPPGLDIVTLAPGPDLADRIARCLIEGFADALADSDCVLPSIALAQPVRAALCAAAGRPLFVPRFLTARMLAQRWQGDAATDPHSRRLLALAGQLRRMAWLGGADTWTIARELIELADLLAGVPVPDEAGLHEVFARSHALHDSEALSLEARLVHAVWLADSTGTPGHARAALQALQRAAAEARRPLAFVADTLDDLPPWVLAYAERAPVLCLRVRRPAEGSALWRALDAAWPVAVDEQRPLRLRSTAPERDADALAGRVRLVAAQSLEQEAAHAAACVVGWLAEGRREIALVAADREAARRTRALLERHGVLLADETGWKLSTTRAAATIDAFLQCLASDGYHRDLLDLVRSPHVAGGMDADAHAQAVSELDAWVVRRNHVDGLQALLADAAHELAGQPSARLLDALAQAVARMPTGQAPAAFWLERLLEALDALQARAALDRDAAGAQAIALLEQLRADCSGVSLALAFPDWRQWLNGEFEHALFRDAGIDSPVVLTQLPATRLRRFDAVCVIGADGDHLAPARPRGLLAHDGLRRELGLPDDRHAARQLREDLASLIAHSDEVVFSWQAQRNGEANLPGADLQLLDLLIRCAGRSSMQQPAPAAVDPEPVALPPPSSAPVLPPERVPARLTASALADLMACPYRYYARRVLGLGEGDEVEESLGKGSVGEWIHRILLDFHLAHPQLAASSADMLVADLQRRIVAGFAPAIARNFQEHAWADRLQARAGRYVGWALEREGAGWRFVGGELARRRELALPDGTTLALEGRIDRVDQAGDNAALIDYKLRSADSVRQSVRDGEDVQLAFYTLLADAPVAEAAYLAIDEDEPVVFAQADPQGAAASLQALIEQLFPLMRSGAPLPAQGDERACSHCGMRGLCRKDWLS